MSKVEKVKVRFLGDVYNTDGLTIKRGGIVSLEPKKAKQLFEDFPNDWELVLAKSSKSLPPDTVEVKEEKPAVKKKLFVYRCDGCDREIKIRTFKTKAPRKKCSQCQEFMKVIKK